MRYWVSARIPFTGLRTGVSWGSQPEPTPRAFLALLAGVFGWLAASAFLPVWLGAPLLLAGLGFVGYLFFLRIRAYWRGLRPALNTKKAPALPKEGRGFFIHR
jgi:hypothetical protein